MKPIPRILLCLSAALLLLAGACHPTARRSTAALLDDVESYINDRPDSALAVLRGLDSTAVRGRVLRARYSLLHTMALDKCYEDITVPGLLDDATSWFSRHGSPDGRMKAYYYQGRIQQDKGNLNAAAIAFSQAEGFAEKASDAHAKGLLYLAFGSVYNAVYNYQQELIQKQKGVSILQEANDPLFDAACGELALVYHSLQEWDLADSLYRKAIEHADNSHAKALYMSNYAKMKVLQPEKDPTGAIELLDLKKTETSSPLTLPEASVYAYASDLLGDTRTADAYLQQIEHLPKTQQVTVQAMLSRIALHRNDYEKAYDYLHGADLYQMEKIKTTLEDSVSRALQDHYEEQTVLEQKQKTVILLVAIGILLMSIIIVLLAIIRKNAMERERDRLYEVRASLIRDMQDLESRFDTLSSEFSKTSSELQQEKEYTHRLEIVKEEFKKERLARFRQMGRLGSTVWQRENKRIDESLAWKELKSQIDYIHQIERGGAELVRRLDSALDGAVSRMRQDLQLRGKPKEVLFLCCCILDMDPIVISDIFELSVDNVYKKKSRYRAKVEALGKMEYIWLLGK